MLYCPRSILSLRHGLVILIIQSLFPCFMSIPHRMPALRSATTIHMSSFKNLTCCSDYLHSYFLHSYLFHSYFFHSFFGVYITNRPSPLNSCQMKRAVGALS